MHMKHLFALSLLFLLSIFCAKAEEITLFNSKGYAIAYIDTDDEDLPIYMWNGKPVAYLSPNEDNSFDIYGFNGKHLGWYEDGIVYNHGGRIIGFKDRAVSRFTRIEPAFKPFKRCKPFPNIQQISPIKPIFQNSFSAESLSLFLMRGAK